MGLQKGFLLVLSALTIANFCSSEFVPVYMWGTSSTSDPVPALQKVNQKTFKDDITSKLNANGIVIVFAEHSLSPEDFGQRDQSGNTAFPYLSEVQKSSQVTYLPSVQYPVKAAKHSTENVAEISIERLKENLEIPEAKVVIVDLNDAAENEQRFDLLKRHDEFVVSTYNSLLKKYDNVLALYTGNHASWSGPGESHSRKIRAIAAGDNTENHYIDNTTIMFYTAGNVQILLDKKLTTILVNYTAEKSNDSIITLNGTGTDFTSSFVFSAQTGYWYLQRVSITYINNKIEKTPNATIYAPVGFSYTCGNQTFSNSSFTVSYTQFQVEPVYAATARTRKIQFDDPYNCVGFTSIPIWSGLFVTFLLLLIMTFGLTMIMDIKTMDRFDDAKGKTITINTSE